MGTLGFAAVERDASRQRADERAGGVLVQPRTVGNPKRSLGELLRLDPSPLSDRNRGALAERHHRHLVRSQLEALLDSVREQVVGLVDLAGQPMRDPQQDHGMRAEAPPTGGRPERKLRIRAHSRHPPGTTLGTQDAQPGEGRRAAVGEGAGVGVFGRVGETLRLFRPALGCGDHPADRGDQGVPLERPVMLQPTEPALRGRDAAAQVGGESATLDEPCHPVDVAGLCA